MQELCQANSNANIIHSNNINNPIIACRNDFLEKIYYFFCQIHRAPRASEKRTIARCELRLLSKYGLNNKSQSIKDETG